MLYIYIWSQLDFDLSTHEPLARITFAEEVVNCALGIHASSGEGNWLFHRLAVGSDGLNFDTFESNESAREKLKAVSALTNTTSIH